MLVCSCILQNPVFGLLHALDARESRLAGGLTQGTHKYTSFISSGALTTTIIFLLTFAPFGTKSNAQTLQTCLIIDYCYLMIYSTNLRIGVPTYFHACIYSHYCLDSGVF